MVPAKVRSFEKVLAVKNPAQSQPLSNGAGTMALCTIPKTTETNRFDKII
jgi:hypothetical protein